MQGFNEDYLHIFSREVLKQIQEGTSDEWEKCVHEKVAQVIKKKKLFGYGR